MQVEHQIFPQKTRHLIGPHGSWRTVIGWCAGWVCGGDVTAASLQAPATPSDPLWQHCLYLPTPDSRLEVRTTTPSQQRRGQHQHSIKVSKKEEGSFESFVLFMLYMWWLWTSKCVSCQLCLSHVIFRYMIFKFYKTLSVRVHLKPLVKLPGYFDKWLVDGLNSSAHLASNCSL